MIRVIPRLRRQYSKKIRYRLAGPSRRIASLLGEKRRRPLDVNTYHRAYRQWPRARRAEAASNAVANALDTGRLAKMPCEVCGKPQAQAHHDSYYTEHFLRVRWLCLTHHHAWHRENHPKFPPETWALD